MITREQALAASSPYLWVLAGEAVFGVAIVVSWNVWAYRDQIAERAAQLLHH